jgi:hypothetical protein
VRAVCFRGSLDQFLSESKEVAARPLDSHPTVVVGFNTGFGNTNRQLTREWLPSLREVRLSTLEVEHFNKSAIRVTFLSCIAATCLTIAAACHTVAATCHTRCATCHSIAATCHTIAATCHTIATTCHTIATTCHTIAATCHTIAATCHTIPATCHTLTAEPMGCPYRWRSGGCLRCSRV